MNQDLSSSDSGEHIYRPTNTFQSLFEQHRSQLQPEHQEYVDRTFENVFQTATGQLFQNEGDLETSLSQITGTEDEEIKEPGQQSQIIMSPSSQQQNTIQPVRDMRKRLFKELSFSQHVEEQMKQSEKFNNSANKINQLLEQARNRRQQSLPEQQQRIDAIVQFFQNNQSGQIAINQDFVDQFENIATDIIPSVSQLTPQQQNMWDIGSIFFQNILNQSRELLIQFLGSQTIGTNANEIANQFLDHISTISPTWTAVLRIVRKLGLFNSLFNKIRSQIQQYLLSQRPQQIPIQDQRQQLISGVIQPQNTDNPRLVLRISQLLQRKLTKKQAGTILTLTITPAIINYLRQLMAVFKEHLFTNEHPGIKPKSNSRTEQLMLQHQIQQFRHDIQYGLLPKQCRRILYRDAKDQLRFYVECEWQKNSITAYL